MSNPYKSFIPYRINPRYSGAGWNLPDNMAPFISTDPTGSQWGTMGLARHADGSFVLDLSSTRSLLLIQFNDRILPGKVRDEKVRAKVSKLTQQEGRSVSKKEYAQIREEIEHELLPKAFIRRSQVPIFIGPGGMMLVVTNSQRKADLCVGFLLGMFDDLKPWKIAVARDVAECLTTLARDVMSISGDLTLHAHDGAVLKKDKETVRIKDHDIASDDVQDLLALDEYTVRELVIMAERNSLDFLTFTLNENLTFKRCMLSDVTAAPLKDDDVGFALLCAQTYQHVVERVIHRMGGEAKREENEDEEL